METNLTALAASLSDVALIAAARPCTWNTYVTKSIRNAVDAAAREARIHGWACPDFSKASRLVGHLRR